MATGQLMFEVGVKSAQDELDKIKKEFQKANGDLQKLLNLKVSVEGIDTITKALNQIGDSTALRNLRNEIAALNREFSILSKGAGGSGDIASRGLAADIEKTNQSIERYTSLIRQLTEERNRLGGGTRNINYQNLTDDISKYTTMLEGARRRLAELNEERNKPVADNGLKSITQDAASFQKIVASVETLSAAANTLKATLGTWDANKGSIAQLVEQFEKLKNEVAAVARELKNIDPSKLNFSGLNLDLGKVAGLGDLNSAIRGLEVSINDIINLFSKLSNAVKLDASSDIIRKLQADADAAQRTIQELTEKMTALAAAQNNVAESASKTGKSEKQIGDSQTALFNRYNKLLADIQNIEREIERIQSGAGGGQFSGLLTEYHSKLSAIKDDVMQIASSNSPAEAITKGMSSEMLAKFTSALAALKTNYKDVLSDAKAFNKATDKGTSQAEARIRKLGIAFNELKNYIKANGGSEEMKRLQSEIQGAIRKMRDLMNAGNFSGAINVYERLSGLIRQAASATKEFEKGQQGLSSSVSHANSNLQHQSQILSDLKTMAMQYLSVWGAQSFINNIIELGGQLEQQRLSIGAILQDTAQANHLFGQIKDLAIKSPFGVQQLDAMSKQLSAYGFQYSELYEWTKRLADISAATGTSVDRLALALGHVRAEGALSGYTLRQFSMGNIPLLQKLSENLGKTKQEIRKMTRNKEIGYEDVLNVLKQLTDESGMFYQAQETMAQALNAKFKNLRDSFQIMYSEMAEGAPGDFLKGVAEMLTDMSKRWRILMPVILSGAGALGVWKLSTMALNYELAKEGVLTSKAAAEKAKYVAATNAQIAATGRLTLALKGAGRAFMSLGKYIFNWWTAGFAAIEGIIYLWSKHDDEIRKAEELTKSYGETAVESEKNIAKQLEKIKPFSNKLDESALKSGIDSMTESIKNYAINGQSIINGMLGTDSEGRVMSLAEKYQYLRGELEKTIDIYKELKRVKDAFEYGITKSDSGWLDDDVDTDLTQYAEAYKKFVDDVTSYNSKYGNSIENAIKAAEKADPVFAKATQNLTSYGDKLAEFWSNPEKYQSAAKFMNDLFGAGAGSDDALNLNESFFGYLNTRNQAMKELDQFIENTEERLKEKGYDFSKELAPEQVGALLKMSKDWIEKHPEWENIYDTIKEKLEGRWPIKIVPDTSPIEEELPQWMKDFQNELDKTGITLTADMSMEQIIDLMKKAYDKAQTTINKLGPIAIKAGIKLEGLTDNTIEQYKFLNPELYETLKELKGQMDSQSQIDTAGKKRGVEFKGMKKDGTHKAEKMNTEAAKAVRERVRVIKEAADAFQYWREKVGDKGAWEHVQAEFGKVLADIGITAQNIEDVRGHLKRIPEMKEYKAITDKKVKTETEKEIAKEEDQFIRKDFEKQTEILTQSFTQRLDELTRAWNEFDKVVRATGNIELAINIANVEYQDGQHTLADAMRNEIENEMSSLGVVPIDFNFHLTEKDIEQRVWDAFAGSKPVQGKDESDEDYKQRIGVYETQIKKIIKAYENLKKVEEDLRTSDIDVYSDLLVNATNLQTEVQKIEKKYLDTIDAIRRLKSEGAYRNNPAAAQEAESIAKGRMDVDLMKASTSYKMLMDGVTTMNKNAARAIRNDYIMVLNNALKEGAITADEYAKEIDKIESKMREYEKTQNNFRAYMTGGLNGLFDNISSQGASKMKEGQELINSGQKQAGMSMMKMGQGMQGFASNMGSTVAIIDMIVHGIDNLVQGMKNTFDEIREMYDALGHDVESDSWQDANTFLSSFSKASSSATKGWDSLKNGDMGGVMEGVVGSFTGWITGFAQGHDRKLDKHIQDIRVDLKKIDNTLNLIKSLREETLGYDKGETRRQLAQYYKNQMMSFTSPFGFNIDLNESASAMYDYYSRGGLSGTGYQQELEALKKQREDYQRMYDEENDKKKKSEEALEEYKAQMAELDITIMNFAKDIANELFSIDLKSWADQIGDALMTAFENGESAAEAFNDSVQDIMRQVLRKMLSLGVIEPMMTRLQKKLFGDNGHGGIFDASNPEGTIDAAMKEVTAFFGDGGEGRQMIEATKTFYDRWEDFMRSYGLNLSEDESSSSTSRSIKGITEQTADLLSAYLNAVRLDVSVIRTMDAKVLQEYWPSQISMMTASVQSLSNIENNTAAIMRSNDKIAESIVGIDDRFRRLESKAWKVPFA